MCTYQTEYVDVRASAKRGDEWMKMTTASVYVDHPVHFGAGHAVMIDVLNPDLGAGSRVAIEMDAPSARALAEAILRALQSAPEAILEDTVPAGA